MFLRGGHFERVYANYNPDPVWLSFEMEQSVPNVLKAIQNYLERCDVPRNQKLGLGAVNAKRKVQ